MRFVVLFVLVAVGLLTCCTDKSSHDDPMRLQRALVDGILALPKPTRAQELEADRTIHETGLIRDHSFHSAVVDSRFASVRNLLKLGARDPYQAELARNELALVFEPLTALQIGVRKELDRRVKAGLERLLRANAIAEKARQQEAESKLTSDYGQPLRRLARKCEMSLSATAAMIDRSIVVLEAEKGFRLSKSRFTELVNKSYPEEAAGTMKCVEVIALFITLIDRP